MCYIVEVKYILIADHIYNRNKTLRNPAGN